MDKDALLRELKQPRRENGPTLRDLHQLARHRGLTMSELCKQLDDEAAEQQAKSKAGE